MLRPRTDVLIVGAGPTGLAVAIALRQAGVDPLVVERLEHVQETSRAAVIHAHTLEQLDRLGVGSELVERGLKLDRFAIRDRERLLLQLRFDRLPSIHPYLLMLSQEVTERVLEARLEALGGHVHRGVTATAVETGDAGARVTLATPEGEQIVSARYVVAADGMHSLVREAADVGFDGGDEEETFVLADVRMDWPTGQTEVSLFFSREGLLVVAPLPDGRFRIVAAMQGAVERPTLADVQDLIDRRGPVPRTVTVRELIWGSRFRIHHRVAERYRAGPLLLIGDAAHVHSPAGGQGMNTGLVDAVVLGQMLPDVVRGARPDAWLDGYDTVRRPAAREVLTLARRLTRLATQRGWRRPVVNRLLRIAGHLPQVRRRLQMNLSGLSRRTYGAPPAWSTSDPRPGTRPGTRG